MYDFQMMKDSWDNYVAHAWVSFPHINRVGFINIFE